MRADEALQKLMDGNRRFIAETSIHPNQTKERRLEIVKGQRPFAVVVGCSDSRVPPEIIFDQGLGDIFVVRVAGNIVDDIVLGSVEYAVEHLNVELVMVFGHGRCGAVGATIECDDTPSDHTACLIESIAPSVEKCKNLQGDLLTNSVKENIRDTMEQLKSSEPVLSKMVKDGKIKVVGAFYHIESGEVEILPY